MNFRTTARQQAESLNIAGIARNKEEALVYIEAEGQEANLNAFIDWCKRGTPQSTVSRVKVEEGPLQNFTEFIITG